MLKLRVVVSGICTMWRGFERGVERFWFLFVGRVRRGFCAWAALKLILCEIHNRPYLNIVRENSDCLSWIFTGHEFFINANTAQIHHGSNKSPTPPPATSASTIRDAPRCKSAT